MLSCWSKQYGDICQKPEFLVVFGHVKTISLASAGFPSYDAQP